MDNHNRNHYSPAVGGRLMYPPGFHCYKCNNTGYKLSNGHACRTCFESFAIPQSSNVRVEYLPPAQYNPGWIQPPPVTVYANGSGVRVVAPGDPSLGGIICGACKGRGYVSNLGLGSFLDELMGGDCSTCRICRGVGRLL